MLKVKIRSLILSCLGMTHPEKRLYENYRSYAEPQYVAWAADIEFVSILEKVLQDVNLPPTYQDGRYILYCLAKQALLLKEGDFIECGVHHGTSSHLLAYVLDKFDASKTKELFAFDSFEGFPESKVEDINAINLKQAFPKGSHNNTGLEFVQNVLKDHTCRIQLVKGWIPQSFAGFEDKKFCFAHIDVDLYQSTRDALSFIYPRMAPGGIVVCDDYGFWMCPGARKAFDEFLKDKPETLLPLPSGQAVLIKSL